MFFRLVTTNTSNLRDGANLGKASSKDLMEKYLCMVKILSLAKVGFLCRLHYKTTNCPRRIEPNNLLWSSRTFDEWTETLGVSERTINRIITFLRQKNIFLIETLDSHKANSTNYYTVNYPELWDLVSGSKELFVSLQQGEAE